MRRNVVNVHTSARGLVVAHHEPCEGEPLGAPLAARCERASIHRSTSVSSQPTELMPIRKCVGNRCAFSSRHIVVRESGTRFFSSFHRMIRTLSPSLDGVAVGYRTSSPVSTAFSRLLKWGDNVVQPAYVLPLRTNIIAKALVGLGS